MTARDTGVEAQRLQWLLERLGYRGETGWVPAGEFEKLATHRFAMQQARQEMGVVGAFCLRRGADSANAVATPLVYIALGADAADAQEIHRKVWSQGLAPFLLVLTPDAIALCPGFSFAQTEWNRLVHWFPWQLVETLPSSPLAVGDLTSATSELWNLRAIRLRTSLFWRDHSIDVQGRVDRRLLENLDALSQVLIDGIGVSRQLSPSAANGLIGRFLYVFFLSDRGIIDQTWVSSRSHTNIRLSDQHAQWPAADTWAFFDDLDSIFNGSIFPLGQAERAEIDESHVNLVRRVMKHGAEPLPSGGVQLSFLDFYLGALRTETLSSVYEQFLENLRSGERRRVGAFYTPPFLVDFMLDRVEEAVTLQDGVTVLDPAAGSGVFLVGVYRRLIERARWPDSEAGIGLEDLRGLLIRNIFGIERNRDACHVAAFSLYLTMLDYIDPRDLTRVAAGDEPERLFPPLIGSNLFAGDFFSSRGEFPGLPERVHCVVGNPPWQTLDKLESDGATKWRDEHSVSAPIGKNQAAELFTWKALREHILPGGVLAFLLPAKSFINPTSWRFRRDLARECTVMGTANFAHLRYRLFASARQAVVAAFVRAQPPSTSDKTWVYSPLSVGQPMARKEWPWTVMLDRADVQVVRHDHVSQDPRGWFEAFMLRPVDRQIRQFLDDSATTGRISLIEPLCHAVGAAVRRGGNASETGIERQYLIDAPSDPVSATELVREHGGGLFGPDGRRRDPVLPPEQLAKLTPPYRHRFGGKVLLVPRNFSNIRFVEAPIGYTSSTLAIFYDKATELVTKREVQLLEAIGRFLGSRVALYLVATTGRRWLMDRRNIEPEDLKVLPIPLGGLDDPRVDGLLTRTGDELEQFILEALGLDGDLNRAIEEFLEFRMGFQDGDVPEQALRRPGDAAIEEYLGVLHRNLDGLIGRSQAFDIAVAIDGDLGVGAVAARFQPMSIRPGGESPLDGLCNIALDRYAGSSGNSFADSLNAAYSDDTSSVTVVKPLEFFRWTVDSAFADSRQIMSAFVAGRS